MGSYTFLIGSYGFNLVNMVNLVRSVRLAVLAKACRHFDVEFLTFLDALPSVTAYKFLSFLDLLASLAASL